jgi:hypothetical protein
VDPERAVIRQLTIPAAIVLGAFVGGATRASAEGPLPLDWITPGQAEPLIKRIAEREPFLKSDEAREERASLNLFFRKADYQVLRGNPVLGYWHSGGFRWVGRQVAWGGVDAAARSCKPITASAWDAAFAYVARKRRLVIDANAPILIRGACVGAVLEPRRRDPKRGVELEVRIESPTGVFRLRFGTGKPTIEDAIGASLDRVLGFALSVGRDE